MTIRCYYGGLTPLPNICNKYKRTVVSTWHLVELLIQQFNILCEFLFWNPTEYVWDMTDFVTTLHVTFGRKLAKLREVKDAFWNENQMKKTPNYNGPAGPGTISKLLGQEPFCDSTRILFTISPHKIPHKISPLNGWSRPRKRPSSSFVIKPKPCDFTFTLFLFDFHDIMHNAFIQCRSYSFHHFLMTDSGAVTGSLCHLLSIRLRVLVRLHLQLLGNRPDPVPSDATGATAWRHWRYWAVRQPWPRGDRPARQLAGRKGDLGAFWSDLQNNQDIELWHWLRLQLTTLYEMRTNVGTITRAPLHWH